MVFAITGYKSKKEQNNTHYGIVVCTISYLCWGETPSRDPSEGS